jgi:hypothetical protein
VVKGGRERCRRRDLGGQTIDRIYNELFWIQVLGTPGVVIGVRSPSRASKSPASMYNVV